MLSGPHGARADQLGSLLGPDASAPRPDPRGPSVTVVAVPSDDGRVAVGGEGHGKALLSGPTAPEPTSLGPCWVQTPPLLVQTHAAPAILLSPNPPTRAVLPSAERDTEVPWNAAPTASEPTSLGPCWVQAPPLRVQIHTAPAELLSPNPPTMAVLPSAERDTETPC